MASKSSSRVLTDHDEIRRWAEERGAKPSAVRRTHSDDNTGIIRLDFPGYSGEDSLEEIEWDEWFDDFDDRNLALIVQDETANGQTSNFNKLVSRDSVEDSTGKTSSAGRGKKASARSSRSEKSSSTSSSSARRSSGTQSGGQKRKSAQTKHKSSRKKAA
jgi:hypothetical protein